MTDPTAREYLCGLDPPLAKAGRGKFSRDAHEALAAALKDGMRFSDYPKDDTVIKVKGKAETVKAPPKPNDIQPDREPVWPETVRVYATIAGKRKEYSDIKGNTPGYAVRQTEAHCGVSLGYCVCHLLGRTPEILFTNSSGFVPVEIKL